MTFTVNVHHKFTEPSVDCAEARILLRLQRIEKLLHAIIGDEAAMAALRDKLKASTDSLDEAVKANP